MWIVGCCLGVWQVTASWSRAFHRPPVERPLSKEQVQQLLGANFGRRLQSDASRFGVSDQFHQDWQLDVHDKVEQVKVAPGGKGEAVISWLTTDRHLPSVVRYKSARSLFSEVAQGEVNVYTTQICLPNSEVMTDPLLGPPNIPLNYDELTALLNTSAFLPKESDSWRFLGPKDDPWDFLEKTNFCVDYKNPKAYYTSPYIHTVTLAGLSGSSEYSFRPEGSSRTFTFTTPPEAGAGTSRPLRVGVWADIGITNVSFGVMSQMLRLAPELLMSVGDLSYADGWAERWDIFGIMMEPLMSSRYHLAVAGNHEMTQNNAVDLIHRYPMPFRPSGAPNPLMFAYETGLLYVLGLPGSYAATDPSSAQWAFAAEKLMAVDRQRTPWVAVMFHTPWYNSNNAHFGEALKHQWDMESLFYQYGVDLVFNGHVHSYERSFPVYNNTVDDCGTVHIVVGDGGNYEGPALYEGHPPGWRQPQPLWSAFREASYGPGLLTIYNSSHAEWRWHRVACVFQNKHHEPVKLTKFTYDGSTKSLGRTRPISAYYWDGVSGPADGPKCSTEGDNSKQAFEASDVVMLVRNPQRCSNKRWKKPPSAAATEFSFRGMTPHLAVLSAASILATLISLRSRMPWSSPARQNGERLLSSPV